MKILGKLFGSRNQNAFSFLFPVLLLALVIYTMHTSA